MRLILPISDCKPPTNPGIQAAGVWARKRPGQATDDAGKSGALKRTYHFDAEFEALVLSMLTSAHQSQRAATAGQTRRTQQTLVHRSSAVERNDAPAFMDTARCSFCGRSLAETGPLTESPRKGAYICRSCAGTVLDESNDARSGTWLRSRRCLLACTLLLGVISVCFWIEWRGHSKRARLDYFEQLGAEIETEPADPKWLRDLVVSTLGQEHAPEFRDVTKINLNTSPERITDAALQNLDDFTSLQLLGLSHTRVTDAGLQHTSGLAVLQELYLNETRVTDAGLQHLRGLANLQLLWLGNTEVTDAGLEHLSGLTSLERLDLGNTAITDAGLQHLSGLTNLEELGLYGTHVSGAGFQYLNGLTSLETLYLAETQVTDAGLQHLHACTNLKWIDLAQTPVTDAGLQHLSALTNLYYLRLSDTQVTDGGLQHLTSLTNLEEFWLDDTQVTDAGLRHLIGLTSLKRLMLGNTQVTDAGVDELQSDLPGITIMVLDQEHRRLNLW